MRKITVFMILIFVLFLTACGGGRVLPLGDSFEEDLGVNGRLEYTIKAARLGEMPVGAGGFLEDSHVTVDGVSYVYPDFLTNGALVSGARLVLLDIEVLNVDADNAGRYEEPYVFRADSIVTLADRSDKAGTGGYAYIDAGLFQPAGRLRGARHGLRAEAGREHNIHAGLSGGQRPAAQGPLRLYREREHRCGLHRAGAVVMLSSEFRRLFRSRQLYAALLAGFAGGVLRRGAERAGCGAVLAHIAGGGL